MAPINPGGRPRMAWDASRKRKLVRLYLMTDLKIVEIQQVLQTNSFNPGTRNIQTQLSTLLPDNVKEWRQYRPCGKQQGVQRLAKFKRCRENQVAKYERCCSRRKVVASPAMKSPPHSPLLQETSALYNPARHYEGTMPGVTPSHPSVATVHQLYFSLSHERESVSQNSLDRSSDKEVVPQDIQPLELSHSSSSTTVAQVSNPEFTISTSVPNSRAFNEPIIAPQVTEDQTTFTTAGITRSNSRASSIGRGTIRTMSTRLSSRLSHSLRHVNSVLSASNSFRSSLVYAPSISSGRFSSTSEAPWTHEDFHAWNDLVDDSAIASETVHRSDIDAKSLYHRPCCGFWKARATSQHAPPCSVCGFSKKHFDARYGTGAIDCSTIDKFGNTPLHHAAAEGNTASISTSMRVGNISLSELSHRNTSGETFLHVFRFQTSGLGSVIFLGVYLEILKSAASVGFQFTTRDHNGLRISQRLREVTDNWDVNLTHLKEVGEILGCRLNYAESPWLQGLPTHVPVLRTGSASLGFSDVILDDIPMSNDTILISALKSWTQHPLSRTQLIQAIQESDIHRRDDRGYTALAIAARLGLREAVSLLLERGANPNTRSHQKTSVIAHATAQLAQAQKENKEDLYARVLSCIVLLSDHGAKPVPTEYDEYYVFTPFSKKKTRFVPGTFVKQTLSQMSRAGSKFRPRNKVPTDTRQLETGRLEMADTSVSKQGLSYELAGSEVAGPSCNSSTIYDSGAIPALESRRPPVPVFPHSSVPNYNAGPHDLRDFLVQHTWLENIPESGDDCLPPYPVPTGYFPGTGTPSAPGHDDTSGAQPLQLNKPKSSGTLAVLTPGGTVPRQISIDSPEDAVDSSSVIAQMPLSVFVEDIAPIRETPKNSVSSDDDLSFAEQSASAIIREQPTAPLDDSGLTEASQTENERPISRNPQGLSDWSPTRWAEAKVSQYTKEGWSSYDYAYDFSPPVKLLKTRTIPQNLAHPSASSGRRQTNQKTPKGSTSLRALSRASHSNLETRTLAKGTLLTPLPRSTEATFPRLMPGHSSENLIDAMPSESIFQGAEMVLKSRNSSPVLFSTFLHQTQTAPFPSISNEAGTSSMVSLRPALAFDTDPLISLEDYFPGHVEKQQTMSESIDLRDLDRSGSTITKRNCAGNAPNQLEDPISQIGPNNIDISCNHNLVNPKKRRPIGEPEELEGLEKSRSDHRPINLCTNSSGHSEGPNNKSCKRRNISRSTSETRTLSTSTRGHSKRKRLSLSSIVGSSTLDIAGGAGGAPNQPGAKSPSSGTSEGPNCYLQAPLDVSSTQNRDWASRYSLSLMAGESRMENDYLFQTYEPGSVNRHGSLPFALNTQYLKTSGPRHRIQNSFHGADPHPQDPQDSSIGESMAITCSPASILGHNLGPPSAGSWHDDNSMLGSASLDDAFMMHDTWPTYQFANSADGHPPDADLEEERSNPEPGQFNLFQAPDESMFGGGSWTLFNSVSDELSTSAQWPIDLAASPSSAHLRIIEQLEENIYDAED